MKLRMKEVIKTNPPESFFPEDAETELCYLTFILFLAIGTLACRQTFFQ